jgi:glutathione S-transferase
VIVVSARSCTLWGSQLSPFSLKARVLCEYAGVDFTWQPADGGILDNFRTYRRIEALKAGRLDFTYPQVSELDDLPLVPYLLGRDGSNFYDSTAMAEWLDRNHVAPAMRLFPEPAAVGFAAALIDEYFDEFGLYMAHHNRWVTAAGSNDAGTRVAREFAGPLPGLLKRRFAERFSARQVRRLPYLFSVAPHGLQIDGLDASRQPPSRPGFPATHQLLDHCFSRMLERMELILSDQPYVLGSRFTVADASAYGALAINTHDPEASDLIELRAPLTYAWVKRIESGAVRGEGTRPATATEDLAVTRRARFLVEEIGKTFVPLMVQNEAAYERCLAQGETSFNEAAFDAGVSLYDGELCGVAFRSVVKTFQVKVWRRLKARWHDLDAADKAGLPDIMP